jgi:hypothetical protein
MALSYRIDSGIVTIAGDYAEPNEWRLHLTSEWNAGYGPLECLIKNLPGRKSCAARST